MTQWVAAGIGALAFTLLTLIPNVAQAEPINVSLQSFATGLSAPVDIANSGLAGDGRLFVVQQTGQVKIVQSNGTVEGTSFLDIDSKVGTDGESGLLSIAFHPDYNSNGFFYLFYTNNSGDNVVARYTAEGDPATATEADPDSEQIVLTIPHPGQTNHNGGDLAFGKDDGGNPDDPYLYISSGDGGGANDPNNYGQRGDVLLGKVLRIDVNNTDGGNNYAIPSSNPYASDPRPDLKKEIWSQGLRNPWRMSFDRTTKDLYIADVGQGQQEEFNFESAASAGGRNYGWRCYEGTASFNVSGGCAPFGSYVPPIFSYSLQGAPCAIIGGYVYRGVQASLSGRYLFADFCTGEFYTARNTGAGWDVTKQTTFSGRNLSAFGESVDGEVYTSDITNGTIYRVLGNPYQSQWVGQSAYPTVPAGDTAAVHLDFKNVGNANWATGGGNPVRVATTQPNDRLSAVRNSSWISGARPGTVTGQVNGGVLDSGDTTIEPGNTGRFSFTVSGPAVNGSTVFRERFRLVAEGNTFLDDQGVFLDVTSTPRSYAYNWAGQTYPPAVMDPGQTASGLRLDLTNTGTAAWRRDNATATRVGTARPRDRNSAFTSGWLSASRLPHFSGRLEGGGSVTDTSVIQPSETARFQYDAKAPAQPGLHREYFEPLAETHQWFGDTGMFWETYVRNPSAPQYAYTYVSQSAYPTIAHNGTAAMSIRLRNTGKQTWQSNGATALKLGTERPRDRQSGFSDNGSAAGWLAASRIKLTRNITDPSKDIGGETSVAEGEIGEFEFTAKALPPAGIYREFFAPVAETIQWLPDIGIFWDFTVTP